MSGITVNRIRNAARAIILRGNNILLLEKFDDVRGTRYALPGGAQEPDETLEQALTRECLEEIGSDIHIRDLIHVADFFKPRATDPPSTRQLVEFYFLCRVADDYVPQNGHRPDKHQVDVIWCPLAQLTERPLLPYSITRILAGDSEQPVYLGTLD